MNNISGNSSDWPKSKENMSPTGSMGGSLLAVISEVLKSVLCVEIENDVFIEIGCYFYRTSAVVKELQISRNSQSNSVEDLQLLSKSVDLAKSLAARLQENGQSMPSSELKVIVEEMEGVIKKIGESLGNIPAWMYGDQDYAEKVAKALSEEMKDATFLVRSVPYSEPKHKSVQSSEVKQTKPDSASELKMSQSRNVKKGEKPIDVDLYPTDISVASVNLQFSDISHSYMSDGLENSVVLEKNDSRNLSGGSSLMAVPELAQYMEPLYDTFFCPLSKRVMEDPVTVESGVTYERNEITEWFDKHTDSDEILCPKSGQKLKSKVLSTNVALKATIDEWKVRNEAARIKVARAALSLASSDNMVLEAIIDLQTVCKNKANNKAQVRNIGMIPMLSNFVQYRSRSIRCATLELLKQLAEDDEEGKEFIAKIVDISIIIKMLSSGYKPIRHASVVVLLELSTSRFMCGKIRTVAGSILTLITAKYRKSSDAFTAEKADEILKNLEKLPENIKIMAENGYWEPLLRHLVEGNEEMRIGMANYLGEIVLGPDSKTYVTERASPSLIQMVHVGTSLSRNAAFKALQQISCYHPNARILVEAGIMQIMVEEMFARTIHNEEMDSKTEAAAILANILESGLELEDFQVNAHGHTMSSDYIIYNIIIGIKNTTQDELNVNLIRIVLCLIKFTKASSTIVSVVKESEASYNLIELINTPNDELGIVSIKLLITLSGFMGHTLSDRLCKTKGLPESLIQNPDEITRITEKHAVSADFLAKLPHQNVSLNRALVSNNVIPIVMRSIRQIQTAGTRSSRHASAYFDGLVGILVRLTTTLYDQEILSTARKFNLASVFTELLTRAISDEVQKLSALGLQNLSRISVNLSRPPQKRKTKTKFLKLFFLHKCITIKLSEGEDFSLCPVHGGVCSSGETFCLLQDNAIDQLLACLDHQNVEIIEATLSALSTLLDDRVNVEKSISLLSEKHVIHHILNVVSKHKEEALWQKAFWMIEKFLIIGGNEAFTSISNDRQFPAILVSAFHHGDDNTRQMAEKILRHLNKIPTLSNTMTFTM